MSATPVIPAVFRRLIAPVLALLLLFLYIQGGGRTILVNDGMDMLFRLRGPLPPEQSIVIVGVDEASLRQYGQWPFARHLHAELLARLGSAKAVAFDFLFPEAGADDAALSAALAKGPPAVLAVAPDYQAGMLKPSPTITGYAGIGHIETMLSGDGIVRQVDISPREEAPAFAVSLATAAGVTLETDDAGLGPRIINFYGPEATFLTLSYRDVLAGRYPPEVFAGRYILVGAQALGLGDSHVTAFTRKTPTPGIEIQASILGNLLNSSFIRPVVWLPFALITCFGALPLFIWPIAGERHNLALNTLLTTAVFASALTLFHRHIFFDFISPLVFLLFTYLFYLLQELLSAASRVLHQAHTLDRQLDARLQQVYHGHSKFVSVKEKSNPSLLSPAGIQDHLGRLQEAVNALSLQHHFLENLLDRELPPVILWESRSGEPVFANIAFREFWQAFALQEEDDLPFYTTFAEQIKIRPTEGAVPQGAGREAQLQFFDVQVRMAAGRRFLQGSMHRLLVPDTGFSGNLVLLQDITEIKELERVKDEVVSIVSHELKQPLTVILGYGQMLTEDLDGVSRTYAQKICSQAERLNRMIRDFLDIARLESGRQQVKRFPFPLERMVREALETIQTAAVKKGIQLREDVPEKTTPYSGDESLLVHAVLNLLDNAVKFSAAGTLVQVSLQEEADRFVLLVADQGPGIPETERQRIFDKFQRGSRTEQDEGFGLGLHLVHQIIEGHGGAIQALAVPVGATFEIILPKLAKADTDSIA
ncbi:MAG: CHASE2 domain-containing protein [Desulfobulbaceae bacterium]|nr:CHASE2 domain-containing protein [Desulfobulbaceae bacterium]